MIGLVPQELATDSFETVWATVSFSRGLFGKKPDPAHLEKVLKDLSLWDKKDFKIITLSGGMKRRVMIAKALAHEPSVLFLDEPTAGVDVELRKDMWEMVRALRASGVTIVLTTHYIEEAEEMADRIGVINKGEIVLVERKAELMRKLGKKQLTLHLQKKLDAIPPALCGHHLTLADQRPGAGLHLRHPERAHRHHRAAGRSRRRRHRLQRPAHDAIVARGHLRRSAEAAVMNWRAAAAIYSFEMARTGRTLLQSIVSPVISTSLYFVVFGAAIGSRITEIEGVSYGSFIVPGLIMLMLLTQSTSNASFGIYFPKFVGTIYEILSAPISRVRDRARLRRRGGDQVDHPRADHSRNRGLLRAAADPASVLDDRLPGPDRGDLQPARFHHRHLGRRFRAAAVHPAADHHAADVPRRHVLFDQRAAAALADGRAVQPCGVPGRGFRWSFYGIADVSVGISLGMTLAFLFACLAVVWWIFRTGYRLKR